MKVRDVVVLQEVAGDLNDGKAFYEKIRTGIGDSFWDSRISDIESLLLHAGFHRNKDGFVCMPNDFLMLSITISRMKSLM